MSRLADTEMVECILMHMEPKANSKPVPMQQSGPVTRPDTDACVCEVALLRRFLSFPSSVCFETWSEIDVGCITWCSL